MFDYLRKEKLIQGFLMGARIFIVWYTLNHIFPLKGLMVTVFTLLIELSIQFPYFEK